MSLHMRSQKIRCGTKVRSHKMISRRYATSDGKSLEVVYIGGECFEGDIFE